MNAVIIVAGGSGRRMGGTVPKQYINLKGKPMIIHTMEKFYDYDPEIKIVLVMARSHRKYWDNISASYTGEKEIKVTHGGETRYDSVKNGLQLIDNGIIVGIHDAVRPLVSRETIDRCYRAATEFGSGIPVVDMDESVRMVSGPQQSEPLDRSRLRRVQTPQVFRSELIKKAYDQTYHPSFTDDASVYESVHTGVQLVEGNPENIKITDPADLQLASLIL